MDPEAHEIRAAKEAYKNISNVSCFSDGIGKKIKKLSENKKNENNSCKLYLQLDYKKKYEETKNKWIWTTDRPDFINAAKNSLQQSDVSSSVHVWPAFYYPEQPCPDPSKPAPPTGWIQVRQRDDEGLCDTCDQWHVHPHVQEECRNGQWCEFSISFFIYLVYLKGSFTVF